MGEGVSISVVIAHYEGVKLLGRALDSAVNQKLSPAEVIVVDDCSSNKSWDELGSLVSRFAGQGTPIVLMRNKSNKGPASCRNTGWRRATGDYVAFLDADDEWHSEKILRVAAAIRDHPQTDFVSHRATTIRPGWQQMCPPKLAVRELGLSSFVLRNQSSTPAVTVRQSLPQRFTENRRYSEDYELWLRLAAAGKTMLDIEFPLVALNREPGHRGLSSKKKLMALGEVESLFRSLLPYPKYWPIGVLAVGWSLIRSGARLTGLNPAYCRSLLEKLSSADSVSRRRF